MKNFIVMIVMFLFMASSVFAQASITVSDAMLGVYTEEHGSFYQLPANTIAMSLTYDGTATTVTACVSAGGDSFEVFLGGNGTVDTNVAYPAGNNGFNLTAYMAAGNTFEDFVAFLNNLDDYTCTIGDDMLPWTVSAAKLKASATTTLSTTAATFYAGYMVAKKISPASYQCAILRGFRTVGTFGSGYGYFDVYAYKSGVGATRKFRYTLGTGTAIEYKLNEIRIDCPRGYDLYFVVDLTATDPNAADFIRGSYSLLRR